MPSYDFTCSGCATLFEVQLLIADRDEPTKDTCPVCYRMDSISRVISAPGVSYTILDRAHVPETFKDVLRQIKSRHLHSTIEV